MIFRRTYKLVATILKDLIDTESKDDKILEKESFRENWSQLIVYV